MKFGIGKFGTGIIAFCAVCVLLLCPPAHAQEQEEAPSAVDSYYTEYDDLVSAGSQSADSRTEGSRQDGKIFVTYNWGASAAWLTRIINQTDRSNFVFKDFLPGLYLGAEFHNVIEYFTPSIRLAAYYPLTSTFNDMPQKPNTPLHFGVDMLAGAQIDLFDLGYFRLNAGPALHLLYMTSDRWNYINLGGAIVARAELPLTAKWTVLLGGAASIDSGNLGGNRRMEPFNTVLQYQVEIGARFSAKKLNPSTIFGNSAKPDSKPKSENDGEAEVDEYREIDEYNSLQIRR